MLLFIAVFVLSIFFFFFNDTATTEIYTLSLHDALPIYDGELTRSRAPERVGGASAHAQRAGDHSGRSEEHTSKLQSPCNLVCRLLLEKKKKKTAVVAIIHTHEPRFYILSLLHLSEQHTR